MQFSLLGNDSEGEYVAVPLSPTISISVTPISFFKRSAHCAGVQLQSLISVSVSVSVSVTPSLFVFFNLHAAVVVSVFLRFVAVLQTNNFLSSVSNGEIGILFLSL
ncbi:MAG: hypothetical protein ACPG4D_10725 [Alphaproteobacteria bacterium]